MGAMAGWGSEVVPLFIAHMAATEATNSQTSSWPVRNQRRHEATLNLHRDVMDRLSELSSQLGSIEERLTSIEASKYATR